MPMSAKGISLSERQIELLLAISELSTKAHRNNLRVSQGPEASNYRDRAQEYKRTKVKLEAISEEARNLEEERESLERELGSYEFQLRTSRDRLDHSSGSDYKSLPALRAEIAALESKVSQYTEEEIGVIDQLETVTKQRESLEADMKKQLQEALVAKESLEALRRDIAVVDESLQVEVAALRAQLDPEVAALLERVPAQVIDKVAYVVGQACSGCRLRISSILLDQIKRFPSDAHYCEECGRLLLPNGPRAG
ncbi:MAG: hypothetical protein M0000_05855 [Actinomycetota bacterium]|nr:hypothetical protein [Actinomycetota bacterium]